MKACPHCSLQIQDAALRCRHCKNWLHAADPPGLDVSPVPRYPLQTTSGLAIASLVLGILWIYWIGSIVALVLGYLALREIRQNPEVIEGRGMATAGIILGWVAMATLVLAIAVGIYIWRTNGAPTVNEAGPSRASVAVTY